ncbi:MAG: hypothetical protein HXY38_16010 [Chloroflexi bacterium]|nr:hypothetical protein [Chloroflexota bacterium]
MRDPERANARCGDGLKSPLLMEWLDAQNRAHGLLTWRGAKYPALIIPRRGLKLKQVDSPPTSVPERLLSPVYQRWGLVSHDGVILRWSDVWSGTVAASPDKYFNMLDTSHALEWELLATLGELTERGKRPSWRQLESRLCLWRAVTLGEAENSCGLGVSLVVRRRQGSGWRALIARRALSKLAIRSGKLHVVPAGMAMPGKTVRHTAIQELLEELLGMEEHRAGFSKSPEYRRLREAGASFEVTGIVLNPLNLTADFCATLTIEDESWWAREPEWRLNHEYGGGLVSLDGAPPWWDIIPQGAGALALAGV